MADEIDMSQETYERGLNAALARRLNSAPTGESHTHCADCEEPIPEKRRIAVPGCKRCVDCQTLQEHWSCL